MKTDHFVEPHYTDDDVMLLNTLQDKRAPSEFTGRYHIHIICYGGKAQFKMAGRLFTMQQNDFVIWQIGSYIEEAVYSPDFDADFLLVSKDFLMEHNPESIWATKAFVFIKMNPVFRLDGKGMMMLCKDFRNFRERIAEKNHLFRFEILGRLMQIFLFDMYHVYANDMQHQLNTSSATACLFDRFMDLVRQHAGQNREVSFYSDKLCVTPKYLSEISRKISHKPASEWISGFAVQEAVSLIRQPELTFAEIADRMNFCNPSHFCRFVKRMMGVSPKEFRKNMGKSTEQESRTD